MFIPGFNDATHRAVVWICDQLPAEVQSQQLVQVPGTCLASGGPPPAARQWGLAPPARGGGATGAYGWPPAAGGYVSYVAGSAAAPPGARQPRASAAVKRPEPSSLTALSAAELATLPAAAGDPSGTTIQHQITPSSLEFQEGEVMRIDGVEFVQDTSQTGTTPAPAAVDALGART
jgi:hypothetical protein